jgi:hypothetical protein
MMIFLFSLYPRRRLHIPPMIVIRHTKGTLSFITWGYGVNAEVRSATSNADSTEIQWRSASLNKVYKHCTKRNFVS